MIANSNFFFQSKKETDPVPDYSAFYTLDTDSTDSSENSYDGTDTNVTYDGEYAVVAGNLTPSFIAANIPLTTAYTYSTWYKLVDDYGYEIIYGYTGSGGLQLLYFYTVSTINDITLFHNGVSEAITTTVPLLAGHIYHITQTWSTTQGYPIVNIYNKTTDESDTLHYTTLTGTTFDGFSVIASRDASSSQFSPGKHSSIRIYNRVIITEEMLAIRAAEIAQHT